MISDTEIAAILAYAIYGLLEGEDGESAATLLQRFGFTDEDGFWKDAE